MINNDLKCQDRCYFLDAESYQYDEQLEICSCFSSGERIYQEPLG